MGVPLKKNTDVIGVIRYKTIRPEAFTTVDLDVLRFYIVSLPKHQHKENEQEILHAKEKAVDPTN
jgi:hypothetical protein